MLNCTASSSCLAISSSLSAGLWAAYLSSDRTCDKRLSGWAPWGEEELTQTYLYEETLFNLLSDTPGGLRIHLHSKCTFTAGLSVRMMACSLQRVGSTAEWLGVAVKCTLQSSILLLVCINSSHDIPVDYLKNNCTEKGLGSELDAIHRGNVQWFSFLSMVTSPRMVFILKKKKKTICKNKTAGIYTEFYFLSQQKDERDRRSGGSGRWLEAQGGVGILVAHAHEVFSQGFHRVGGGTRLDGLRVVCKEEGLLGLHDDYASFSLKFR